MAIKLKIGDLVKPINEPNHRAMTIYDISTDGKNVHLNWLTGIKMHKFGYPTNLLEKVYRVRIRKK